MARATARDTTSNPPLGVLLVRLPACALHDEVQLIAQRALLDRMPAGGAGTPEHAADRRIERRTVTREPDMPTTRGDLAAGVALELRDGKYVHLATGPAPVVDLVAVGS